MDPEVQKLLKAIDDFLDNEYNPGNPTPTGWEDVELEGFFSKPLTPTDTIACPPNFSTSFDVSTAFTGADFSNFSQTDAQTSFPDFSTLSDAHADFHQGVLPLEPNDGDADSLFDAYTPPLSLPSPTPTQYSLPSKETIAPAFIDVFQCNAPALDPLSSHFSQSSTDVITPFVPNSPNPAASKHTFADWNSEPSYPPSHLPTTLPTQPFFIPPTPGATYLSAEESESFSQEFHNDMLSVHPPPQQMQGSIGPIRTSGEVRYQFIPYERPQVDGSSESRKENDLNPGPLVILREIPVPPGKNKFMLTKTDKLEIQYPRIDPSAFYFFKAIPTEFNCPVLGCTAILQITEIKDHGATHVQPDGKVLVSDPGSGGSYPVEAKSFVRNVTDRKGKHTCPYCNRSVIRCEQYDVRRHLSTCQGLEELAAEAREVFASRGY